MFLHIQHELVPAGPPPRPMPLCHGQPPATVERDGQSRYRRKRVPSSARVTLILDCDNTRPSCIELGVMQLAAHLAWCNLPLQGSITTIAELIHTFQKKDTTSPHSVLLLLLLIFSRHSLSFVHSDSSVLPGPDSLFLLPSKKIPIELLLSLRQFLIPTLVVCNTNKQTCFAPRLTESLTLLHATVGYQELLNSYYCAAIPFSQS